MGGGFVGGSAGQRSDLIAVNISDAAVRVVVLVLLGLDGVLCAVAAALLLPSYLGGVWFPVSAVLAGLVNSALVWAAMQCTTSGRLAALPLLTWLLTVLVLAVGGPRGDIRLDGAGIAAFGPILLLLVGAGPALWLLSRRNQQQPVKRG